MPRKNPDWESNYTSPKIMAYPAVGDLLKERYHLLKVIKKGGMSTVYKAEDKQMQHTKKQSVFVAVKVLAPYLLDDKHTVEKFQEEAIINMEKLGGHQNIVNIHSYEQDGGYHFFIMQWLDGHDLDDELRLLHNTEIQGISLGVLLGYLGSIVSALSYAHKRGVIHRDIKPGNLFKCKDNNIVLLDFGVSHNNDDSSVVSNGIMISGSYEYMPPEADIASHVPDAQDDIYGLAICIYQLLSGELPFKGRLACHRDQTHEDMLVKPCVEMSQEQWLVLKNAFTIYKEERKAQTIEEFLHFLINPPIINSVPVKTNAISAYIDNSKSLPFVKYLFLNKTLPVLKVFVLGLLLTGLSYTVYIWQNKDRQYIEQEITTRQTPALIKRERKQVQNRADADKQLASINSQQSVMQIEDSAQLKAPAQYDSDGKRAEYKEQVDLINYLLNMDNNVSEKIAQSSLNIAEKKLQLLTGNYAGLPGKEELTVKLNKARLKLNSNKKIAVDSIDASTQKKVIMHSEEQEKTFMDDIIEMEFVLIKAGRFIMGSPDGRNGSTKEMTRDEDENQHEVTISRDYYLGKYEVNQGQWKIVMGSNPSYFSRCGSDCPVEEVSWNDVQTFILRLNEVLQASGKNYTYRLPTEAEWEYAARAGTTEATYNGNLTLAGINNIPELDKIAWYGGNSEATYVGAYDCSDWSGMQYPKITLCGTQSAGGKKQNSWGLHDMLGNVWEWVADRYTAYPKEPVVDPIINAQKKNAYRVYRGGGWGYNASFCRAAKRNRRTPDYKHYNLGFRLARDVP